MKLGVIVDNLGPSQLSYNIIKNVNLIADQKPDLDCIAFYENFVRPCFPMNFACMQVYEAWGYNGVLVSTNLNNSAKLLNFPFSSNKYFYIWDLEWLRLKSKSFRQLYSIYNNPSLKLIARSQSHKDIIEDSWNVRVSGIVDDFDINQLLQVIDNDKSK